MGVSGLLRVLKSITNTEFHVSSLKGMRVAIDGYSWLHKGAYNCSEALALGQNPTSYVDYVMSWIRMLQSSGIEEIIVVFDGQGLAMKENTASDRRDTREDNLAKAMEAKASGDNERALTYFQRSISITFDMVQNVINTLKQNNIKYMIAPYEADAQLAFLSMNKLVDAVISEDSDVLVYGCRRVIYKLDRFTGFGHEICRRNLGVATELSFISWNDEQFVLFCCLVGCDYCPNLHGMGIKTAHKYAASYNSFDTIVKALKKNWKNQADLSDEYFLKLWRAYMTFRHQTVFGPIQKKMIHLREISEAIVARHTAVINLYNSKSDQISYDFNFLGKMLSDDIAEKLVRGFISPSDVETGNLLEMNAEVSTSMTSEILTSTVNESNKDIHEEGIGQVDTEYANSTVKWTNNETTNLETKDKNENIWAFQGPITKDLIVKSKTEEHQSHGRAGLINTLTLGSHTKSKTLNMTSDKFESNLVSADCESLQRKKRRLTDETNKFVQSTLENMWNKQSNQKISKNISNSEFFDITSSIDIEIDDSRLIELRKSLRSGTSDIDDRAELFSPSIVYSDDAQNACHDTKLSEYSSNMKKSSLSLWPCEDNVGATLWTEKQKQPNDDVSVVDIARDVIEHFTDRPGSSSSSDIIYDMYDFAGHIQCDTKVSYQGVPQNTNLSVQLSKQASSLPYLDSLKTRGDRNITIPLRRPIQFESIDASLTTSSKLEKKYDTLCG